MANDGGPPRTHFFISNCPNGRWPEARTSYWTGPIWPVGGGGRIGWDERRRRSKEEGGDGPPRLSGCCRKPPPFLPSGALARCLSPTQCSSSSHPLLAAGASSYRFCWFPFKLHYPGQHRRFPKFAEAT